MENVFVNVPYATDFSGTPYHNSPKYAEISGSGGDNSIARGQFDRTYRIRIF